MDLVEIAKLSPGLLGPLAAMYLFKLLQESQAAHRTDLATLVERYHTFVTNHTVTLRELVELWSEEKDATK
jgi:hypothetical protein